MGGKLGLLLARRLILEKLRTSLCTSPSPLVLQAFVFLLAAEAFKAQVNCTDSGSSLKLRIELIGMFSVAAIGGFLVA